MDHLVESRTVLTERKIISEFPLAFDCGPDVKSNFSFFRSIAKSILELYPEILPYIHVKLENAFEKNFLKLTEKQRLPLQKSLDYLKSGNYSGFDFTGLGACLLIITASWVVENENIFDGDVKDAILSAAPRNFGDGFVPCVSWFFLEKHQHTSYTHLIAASRALGLRFKIFKQSNGGDLENLSYNNTVAIPEVCFFVSLSFGV